MTAALGIGLFLLGVFTANLVSSVSSKRAQKQIEQLKELMEQLKELEAQAIALQASHDTPTVIYAGGKRTGYGN